MAEQSLVHNIAAARIAERQEPGVTTELQQVALEGLTFAVATTASSTESG